MTDVPDVINVISVPIVIVVLNVHNVIIVPDVLIVLDVPNVLIVLIVLIVPIVHYYPDVLSVIYSLFQKLLFF